MAEINRRDFVLSATAAGLVLATPRASNAAADKTATRDRAPIYREIERSHDETVQRLQD